MKNPAPLRVIGLGPGNMDLLTPLALKALENSGCIAGYGPYLDLLPDWLKEGRKLVESGMGREKERCEKAIEEAAGGVPTALVCSGDPGIYALACLVIELLEKRGLLDSLPFEIIPGVPALAAAAARLGAPLSHDFACISLSDLLTPWRLIEKRLNCAFEGDFVCVLYNPRSKGRPQYLGRAVELAKKWRDPGCPVAAARNAYREGEKAAVFRLQDFDPEWADMRSLIIIGNSESRTAGRFMLTPRGYFGKGGL